MKKNLLTVFICLILTSVFFSSCGNSPKSFRFDVSNYVSYLETPPGYGPGQVLSRTPEFKHLEKKDRRNLVKLLSDDKNYIWLKIQFTIPEELKNQDLGLFIGYIRGADLLFIIKASDSTEIFLLTKTVPALQANTLCLQSRI